MKQFKYIVIEDSVEGIEIRFGYVEYHKHLAPMTSVRGMYRKSNVDILGGGQFKIDEENKKIILFGKSDDYGAVPEKILKTIRMNKNIAFNLYMITCHLFDDKIQPEDFEQYTITIE